MRLRSSIFLALCLLMVVVLAPPAGRPPGTVVHSMSVGQPQEWSGLQASLDARVWWYASIVAVDVPPPRPARVKPVQSGTVGAAAVDGTVWDRIAECESGGDWSINTGNGYFGGLQMDMAFWRTYGGLEFAARPDLASREQQIIVAERARDSGRGYGPWPVCGRLA